MTVMLFLQFFSLHEVWRGITVWKNNFVNSVQLQAFRHLHSGGAFTWASGIALVTTEHPFGVLILIQSRTL